MPISPRPSSTKGFLPLGNSYSNNFNMDDNGIPLTNVRSNASTGARKPSQGVSSGIEALDQTRSEKHGFFHRGGGRRRAAEPEVITRRGTGGSEDVSLNAMGRLYNKIISFSVVTRYLVYILPVAIILAVPLIVVSVTSNWELGVGNTTTGSGDDKVITIGPPIWKLFVWIEAAWLSLWVGKIVAHLLPPIFMFFCGVVSSGTRKYATVIRALEIPLSLFFWALASWLIFKNLIQGFDSISWVSAVKNILGALFVSSAVFLGEKAIVQLISITYHQRSFANRIKDSKREVFLLGLMYDASRTLFPMYCPEFAEEDYIINDSIELMLGGKKGHKKSGSVTPMRLIGNVGRFGDKVTSVFGNLASEITGKQVFNPNSAHSVVVEALEKVRTSEAMAKRIWMSFVVEGKDSLFAEDIIEVLGPAHQMEAEECFHAVDADGNGDISLDEMIRKVVEISKERKAISNSMKDISQALAVFDKVLLFIVLLIVIFIFLAFFQSSFLTTLATAGTALLSLSFVFAVTTQEFLGSCIFLFVKHPYDVGDRVDIVGPEKEQLTVEKISLLYTVFNRIDKMQVVQVPNIVLNNLWIENVTRSKAMKEVIEVNISFDTSFEDIELLRIEMEKFVRHPDNARDFLPDIVIGCGGVGDLDKLQLKIAIKHKSNWHNDSVRATRRSKFMCALALALKAVPIAAPGGGGEPLGGPTNPAYNVAVTDTFASSAREKSDKEKEAKRMAAPKPERNPSTASRHNIAESNEMEAAQHLNKMSAARAAAEDWGYNRDDDTLNSRDQSAERDRSTEIDNLRLDLHKRESTRSGRRVAGTGLPANAFADNTTPGIQVTQYKTGSFDEEAAIGGAGSYGAHPQAQSSYNIFPGQQLQPSGSYSPPIRSNSQTAQAMPHPLQSAPSPSRAATVSGARTRGASVSRPLSNSSNNPYQQQR
ncbi:Mechanosensitive ion channel-domain-containing protein [Pseudomassariella vexata]|uniref:Mechanosensitive ion channel protein n=1 Tax=Pseudomassariella vexata TaxID=1141098 RepID=A0A1Y2DXG0_9PEZI|nr:Mechanosensitive ion channel-domain-containing protein [Pseudomassariella vexata]ORY63951.1 Mechanosensitive ion channel-domain-containing protein [Pseudomassariella vexata]